MAHARNVPSLVVTLGLALICSSAAPVPSARAEVPLIAREKLFGNPDRAQGRISPDGKYLSWLAPVDGVLNVWVAAIGTPDKAVPVTNDKVRGIRSYNWAFDGTHLIYQQDRGGNENFHVYAVDVAQKTERDLTPFEGARATLNGASRKIRDELLVTINQRDPKYPDLYRVKIATGELTMIAENPGFAGFLADEQYNVPVAVKPTQAGGEQLLRKGADGRWTDWMEFAPEDARVSGATGFNRTGTAMFLRDSRGRDTGVLKRIDLTNGSETVLAANDEVDIGAVIGDAETGEPIAYSINRERPRWVALSEGFKSDLAFLDAQQLGDWSIGSRTEDDRLWVVGAATDLRPGAAYLYDRSKRTLTKLYDTRPELATAPLVPMQSMVVKSRDGLDLVTYLTLPKAGDGTVAKRPAAPLATVLFVHGGPWARDGWGYSATHQWLANRGYAVLSVNFRGSTGFGKGFVNAGDRQWGRAMQDDLNDVTDWAIREKIADPMRLAIFGGSYGGYAVLAGVTRDPDRWACGVDVVGPSNLETLLKSIPPYWEAGRAQFARSMGDLATDEGRALLKDRSPLFRADRIKKPLLIAQGANDPRVNKAESDQMVAAMKARSIPVSYALYTDEGHGFARPPNSISFNALTELFLKRCLGGRAEPIDAATLKGASLQMLEGAGLIEGLEAAQRAVDKKS